MRLIFFALLGINVAALILQLTIWQPSVAGVTARQAVVGGEQLQFWGEANNTSVTSVTDTAADRAEPQRSKPVKPVLSVREQDGLCDMVGPYAATQNAKNLVQHLQALDAEAWVQELDVPEGVGYWVHLPPEPSRKEALRRLREVQAKQIDSYMIPRGELANGISFGMFTRKELAEARLKEMREQGYAAEVREITRTHKEVWVVLGAGEGQKIGEKAWVELLESENGIEKQQKYCQGVASR
ncbi:SPOR domain-containing protein [Gilvimarinus polysaccharolyticus]|uniref:SPOR domain-containing protein n=1 Tax=Gilvimarinus polysaccharolyticus TaxID=863921 RepID=UPI0012F74C33|nr:SPOR domain-containing protein [Gilvimarinus polysaccharolyticus]